MKYILFLSFLFLYTGFHSQITIDGNAPSFKGKYVSLLAIDDYITYKYKSLGKQKVDSLGKFYFKLNTDKNFKAIIEIGDKSAIIYIDSSTKNYIVNFTKHSEDGGHIVKLIFENLPKDDLNSLILEYNLRADNFMFGDSMRVIKCIKSNNMEQFSIYLDDFKDSLIEYYKPIDNKYFHNYIRYSIASLEQLSTGKDIAINRINVFNNYIKEKPVLYDNDAYMSFINQFYENSLRLPVKGGEDKLYLAINNYASKSMLNEIFVSDVFLQDERIREIVMIKGLGEEYYTENYIKENIIKLLTEISQESAYAENRIIAKNTIAILTNLQKGYRAPDFSIITSNKDTLTLDYFKGKYIYISFWASWNKPSLMEIEITQKLHKDYGKYIEFISISADKEESDYLNFIKEHPKYKWHFAHYQGEIGLLTDYRVKNVPEYFLIGPDGKIIQAPAYKPSPNGEYQSIDKTFFEIKKKLEPKKTRVIGGKG